MPVLALALAAAAAAAPPMLGPFQQGQSVDDASGAATRAGLSLKLYDRRGRYDSYWIVKGQSDVRGALGVCGGRVQFASFIVEGFDNFTALLRDKTEEWGQPQVKVVTIQVSDASRTLERMTFKWPAHGYELTFNARKADGMNGNQSFGGGLKCL